MLLACAILLAGCGANGAVGSGNENRSYITREEAQNIALREAGVSTEDAVFENKEFDLEDGSPVYELEFQANGVEYEYDIHAETGEILRAEQDVQRQRTWEQIAYSENKNPAGNCFQLDFAVLFYSLLFCAFLFFSHGVNKLLQCNSFIRCEPG